MTLQAKHLKGKKQTEKRHMIAHVIIHRLT